MAQPEILIIAGPNGAGKTTFATEYLRYEGAGMAFVNADLIAAGLNPTNPAAAAMTAGRLMLEEIERHIRARQSFAFETTLSGKRYAARIQQWKQNGWRIHLIFLRLESSTLAIQRVQKRVRLGGHDIPPRTVIRRYDAGLANLREIYLPIVDSWSIYDNSGSEPVLLEHGTHAA